MDEKPLKIAVIGAGVAGLTAAHLLQRKHHVTLYEKSPSLGGHANTIVIDNGPDKGTPIDTGFVVLNDRTDVNFHKLLNQLEVPVRDSDMSFGFYDEKSRLQYAGTNLNGLFAQRSRLWDPAFWHMLLEIARFRGKAKKDLALGRLEGQSLGEYLDGEGFFRGFIHDYILPMGGSLWSTSGKDMAEFPADVFVRFLDNHGLMRFTGRPKWRRIVGGSHSYVKAFLKGFKGRVKVNAPVDQVKRAGEGVSIKTKGGEENIFDKVVLAGHADEALALLAEPTEDEQRLLSRWFYQKNHVTLHTDVDVMPPLRRGWASWNYIREMDATKSEPASVTYHMNRLQGLKTQEQYFITLNRVRPIPVKYVIKELYYTNPTFTRESVETQKELPLLNGVNNTYYCGSYFGYGFHEDAVRSALAVARSFGLDL